MTTEKPPDKRPGNFAKMKEKLFTHEQFTILTGRHYKMIKDLQERVEILEGQLKELLRK